MITKSAYYVKIIAGEYQREAICRGEIRPEDSTFALFRNWPRHVSANWTKIRLVPDLGKSSEYVLRFNIGYSFKASEASVVVASDDDLRIWLEAELNCFRPKLLRNKGQIMHNTWYVLSTDGQLVCFVCLGKE